MKRKEKGGPIKGPRKVFIGHNQNTLDKRNNNETTQAKEVKKRKRSYIMKT